MQKKAAQISFEITGKVFRGFLRQKAIKANTAIVYAKDGSLIDETPKTSVKSILNGNLLNIR